MESDTGRPTHGHDTPIATCNVSLEVNVRTLQHLAKISNIYIYIYSIYITTESLFETLKTIRDVLT